MLAKQTVEQRESHDRYMEKLQDIKVRVPKEHYQTIKSYAESKGTSINKLIISLLEKEIGTEFTSIREQNRLKKDEESKQRG